MVWLTLWLGCGGAEVDPELAALGEAVALAEQGEALLAEGRAADARVRFDDGAQCVAVRRPEIGDRRACEAGMTIEARTYPLTIHNLKRPIPDIMISMPSHERYFEPLKT